MFTGNKPGMAFTDSEEKPYEIFIGTNYGFKVNIIRYFFVFITIIYFALLYFTAH